MPPLPATVIEQNRTWMPSLPTTVIEQKPKKILLRRNQMCDILTDGYASSPIKIIENLLWIVVIVC